MYFCYLSTSKTSKIPITALPYDKVVVSPCQPVNIEWHWPTFGYTHAVCFGELVIISLIAALVYICCCVKI